MAHGEKSLLVKELIKGLQDVLQQECPPIVELVGGCQCEKRGNEFL